MIHALFQCCTNHLKKKVAIYDRIFISSKGHCVDDNMFCLFSGWVMPRQLFLSCFINLMRKSDNFWHPPLAKWFSVRSHRMGFDQSKSIHKAFFKFLQHSMKYYTATDYFKMSIFPSSGFHLTPYLLAMRMNSLRRCTAAPLFRS